MVKFVKWAYNYEQWEVYETLIDMVLEYLKVSFCRMDAETSDITKSTICNSANDHVLQVLFVARETCESNITDCPLQWETSTL